MEVEENSLENQENTPLLQHSSNNDLRKYIINGALVILAQMILSAYTLISVLYVKNEKIDIIIVIFFRSIISSSISLLIAYFCEGKLEFPPFPFYWYIFIS